MDKKIFTIPNIISLIRIVLIPFFLIIFCQRHYLASIIFLFFICISDYFDGYLARRLNQDSKLGQILDPISDRALILSVYLCGGLIKIVPIVFFILIIFRDIVVGIKMLISKKVNKVNFAGKFGSFALMTCAPAFILSNIFTGTWFTILQGLAFAIGIWGIYMYYIAGFEYLFFKNE